MIIATTLTRDFTAFCMGHVSSDLGGHQHVHRFARPLLHALSAFHPLPADDLHVRSQGGAARSRSAFITGRKQLECRSKLAGNPRISLFGVAAEFDSAGDLFHAAEQMRDAGFTRFDVFSPFPIHGMDAAMGLKRSVARQDHLPRRSHRLYLAAVTIQFVPSSFIYPLIVAGKPTNLFTVPAFFPIMFEFTVLISAFTATFSECSS